LLHGYGADGGDLIELGRVWRDQLPDAAFIAPHAPEPCPMSPAGRQWWPLTFRDDQERWRGVNAVEPDLEAFFERELSRHRLGSEALALVGFSQGAMTALHVGLRRAVPPAAILAFSGALAGGEHLARERTIARERPIEPRDAPPILLIHGDSDPVIPVGALFEAANALAAAGIAVEWHVSPGLAHGIDEAGLSLGGRFLARAFQIPRIRS
jgi:phospholipase/carboxylesterase